MHLLLLSELVSGLKGNDQPPLKDGSFEIYKTLVDQ
tara:strand:- start:67 stop:174 length:108 start_codon:yes stop_codon:yes gene_type:complete